MRTPAWIAEVRTLIGSSAGKYLCTVAVQLSCGTLTVQGLTPDVLKATPLAVTGGTGACAGARGTAILTDMNSTTTNIQVTIFVVA